MESVTSSQAHQFYALSHFLQGAKLVCANQCVVDLQTKDLSAMERECANACI